MLDLDALGEQLSAYSDAELISVFWVAVVVSLVLPRLPYGRTLLYPFALLGTWAHELGHGITALLIGGRFDRLLIFRNLDGLAYSSGVGPFGRAVVAAGGLLAPAVVGGIVVILGSREPTVPFILVGVAIIVLASTVLFVRNAFGRVSLGLTGIALLAVAVLAPKVVAVFVAELIGIQFCLASWGSLDYMFTKSFHRYDGTYTESDTQTIANVLVLPYWFWGGLIAAVSLLILGGSFYVAWVGPLRA